MCLSKIYLLIRPDNLYVLFRLSTLVCLFARESHLESVFPREYLAGLSERPCPASDPRDALIRISNPAVSRPRIAFTSCDIVIRPSWQDHAAAAPDASLVAHLPRDLE